MLLRLSNRLPMEVFLIERFSRQNSKIGLVNSKNAKRGLIQRICRLTWLKFQLISPAEEDDQQAADSYHSASIHQYALDPCLSEPSTTSTATSGTSSELSALLYWLTPVANSALNRPLHFSQTRETSFCISLLLEGISSVGSIESIIQLAERIRRRTTPSPCRHQKLPTPAPRRHPPLNPKSRPQKVRPHGRCHLSMGVQKGVGGKGRSKTSKTH